MIIYEETNNLVSGAFPKCLSTFFLLPIYKGKKTRFYVIGYLIIGVSSVLSSP